MPVPGMKACKFFETAEDIYEQWPDLRYLPRPEPEAERTEAHKRWRKEYSHWKSLKCGNSVGYFCRAHGWWITCVEIKAKVASPQSKESYDSCPERHYELHNMVTQFHLEKEAEHTELYEQTKSGAHGGGGNETHDYDREAAAYIDDVSIDDGENRADASSSSRDRVEGKEHGYAPPNWDHEEWMGGGSYLPPIQSDRDDGHGSEVQSVLSSSPAHYEAKSSKHRHRSSKTDKLPSKSTAESSKTSKSHDSSKRSSKKGKGGERRTQGYDQPEAYDAARGSFDAPSYEEDPSYEYTGTSRTDGGDDRHVDFEHDSSRRIPRPQPELDFETQPGSSAGYYFDSAPYAPGGQAGGWEESYSYERPAKQKSSRHGKKGTTK